MTLALLLESSFILVVGLLLSAIWLRKSPAARYTTLLACLVALLLLPVLAPIEARSSLVTFHLPLLPAVPVTPAPDNRVAARPQEMAASLPHFDSDLPEQAPRPKNKLEAKTGGRVDRNSGAIPLTDAAPLPEPRQVSVPKPAFSISARANAAPKGPGQNWLALIEWLYGVVCLFFLVRFSIGSLRLRLLVRGAKNAPRDPSIEDAIRRVKASLGVRRFPLVLASGEISTPIAVGIRRPAILLPSDLSTRATPEELEAILLHEYAHLDQGHAWSVLISAIVKAIYWPNPLVYWAAFELSRAREEVSDNYVLHLVPAQSFARTLLHAAQWRGFTDSYPAAAGLLLPHWNLERRVAGLLDPTRLSETRISRLKMTTMYMSAACLCAALAGVQLSHAQSSTIVVKQGNKTYVLHPTKKHPVTVKMRKHGADTTIVFGPDSLQIGASTPHPGYAETPPPPASWRTMAPPAMPGVPAAPAMPPSISFPRAPSAGAPRANLPMTPPVPRPGASIGVPMRPPGAGVEAVPGVSPVPPAPTGVPPSAGVSSAPIAATPSAGFAPTGASVTAAPSAGATLRPGAVGLALSNSAPSSAGVSVAAPSAALGQSLSTVEAPPRGQTLTGVVSAEPIARSGLALAQGDEESAARIESARRLKEMIGAQQSKEMRSHAALLKAELARIEALSKQGSISQEQVEEMRAKLDAAKAELNAAQAQQDAARAELDKRTRAIGLAQLEARKAQLKALNAQRADADAVRARAMEELARGRTEQAESLARVKQLLREESLAHAGRSRSLTQLLEEAEREARAEGKTGTASRLRQLRQSLAKRKKRPN